MSLVQQTRIELYFSRMVCKHKSEWSYKWAKIKSDYEKFIKYHYPKAKQEYVDERLDEIQAKYDALYDFWYKLEFKTDTFWHFEPFAWVDQMKRVFSVSKWHEPVENPERSLFNSEKYPPRSGAFGSVRTNGTKNHGGIDIFAPIGEPIYACLDGEVVSARYRGKTKTTGYGNTIIIKVAKEDLEACRNSYKLEFPNSFKNGKGEVEKGKGFGDSDERYLLYAHLDTMLVKKGDKVTAGQQIATGGKTGNAETIEYASNRHLHFEVLSSPSTVGYSELLNRENPAFYVNFIEANEKEQRYNKD
ncbi:M23 family metallopeptidase [Capnocytophaga cynodegmi]|uniref:M23 family metallopeptidase n=1 Tax=Capnocytophaga cynodegmi TaxID=28189 RepID=UPI00385C5724